MNFEDNSFDRRHLLKAAFEQIDVPILMTTAELDLPGPQIVFVNAALARMTGYAPDELIGQTPRLLQGAKTDRAALRRLRENLSRGEKFHGETYNYRKNGSAYFLEWHISPVRDARGRVTHFVSVQKDVTTRKLYEEITREAHEYKNLFNLVNDAIIVFDPTARVVLNVNEKACECYKIRRHKFIGFALDKILDAQASDSAMLAELLTKGAVEEFESVHRRSDNAKMHVVINCSLVQYQGKPAVLSINRDVTERYEAELAIKKAKDEWTHTVDAISDLIVLADSRGQIRRCNRAAARFFDAPYEKLIGQSLDELLWRGNGDARSANFNRESGGAGKRQTWEEQLPGRDEWFEFSSHAVSNATERGWVHIVKDVTERKASEAALKRLDTAIEQAADGILIFDVDKTIQYVNPAFEAITGYNRCESIKQNFADLGEDLLPAEISAQMYATVAGGKVWNGVCRARRKTGEFYEQEINVSPVRDAAGELLNYVLICRDATEKRRLESIAEAVNMMENVGYVFSGIRHELGNPINSVKTALSVLRKNIDNWEKEQTVTYIDRSLREIGRVEYLLRALKTFSLHENPKMQSINVRSFMESFVALIENDFAGRGISIELDGAEAGEAWCDPRALHQVMLNLAANAGDALAEAEDARILISLSRDERFVHVSVADNGTGMTELQMENLFKPFYTSKPEGTGLGLVIVKKMLAKMNGTIQIQSAHGSGAIVHFTLEAARTPRT